MWTSWLIQLLILAVVSYAFLLAKRLDTSRHVRTEPFPSDEQLLQEDYKDIDVLEPSIRQPSHKIYLITGGFGQLGLHGVVDLLYRRGERQIHILDVAPPPPGFLPKEGIIWHKCDLSSEEAVNKVFEEVQPDVVFALAAIIRFWERHAFSHKYSTAVNVDGTRNVLQALASSPSASEKILIYCSSAAVSIAAPNFMRLGRNWRGEYKSYTVSDENELPYHRRATHSYARSKYAADKLVRQWNGRDGLRTGVLRPGMTVASPNDLVCGRFLRAGYNPTVTRNFAQHFINTQDLAACFLLYELALRTRPEEVAGEAFLVTGEQNLWTWDELRYVLQLFAGRNLQFWVLPALPMFVLAHIIETYNFVRYYLFLPFSLALFDAPPRPHPRWMEKLSLHALMPASWNTFGMDVAIDDSRARKMLGYRNKFSNAQTLRWVVEEHYVTTAKS